MTKIALVGAGGKMGRRLTDNFLKRPEYDVSYLEVAAVGIDNLRQRGVSVSEPDLAVSEADVVILALPDVAIGRLSATIIPEMKTGALVLTLDPAAPLDGVI
ncbi:MAG TPA: NAD(P)-binding domain-containing protein, partial [Spirosoma sp.]|nr:NAD(P)-binding domain-containing protein [Spirosoma sp.]